MSSRVLKVNPGQYDQVVAITQAMINAGMENLYIAKTPDPPKPQTITIRAAGSMLNVILKAPRIIISPVQNNLSQVIYVMGFSSGTLAVYSTDGSDPATEDQKTNYSMENWKFAFAVDLGLSKLDPTSQSYKDVRAKINQPGNYTITQLLLDLSTAGISEFNIKQSYFGGKDWSKESQDVQDNFSVLIKKALNQIFGLGLNNVGYLASTDAGTTGDHPATFLPTDVRFQTYPWVGPTGVEVGPGITGNSVLNYLCYLEMTDNKAPPTGVNAVLIPNGNWTDGDAVNTSSMDLGTFVLSKRNFLDRWFLPQLRAMNQILEPTVSKIPVSVRVDGLWLYWTCRPDMQLGYNPSHPSPNDSYFDFKPTTPYTVAADIPNVIKAGTYQCYQFTSSFTASNSFDQAGAGGALAKVWGAADCSCTNRLLFKAGSSQIVLLGTANIHTNFSRWAPLWDAPSSKDDDIKYTYNWSVVFNLESVKDGGLQVTAKVTQTSPVKSISLQDGIGAQLVKYFDSAFPIATGRFTSFQNNLAAALAGQQKFYFPASGTFFFKNPVMNYQGDLIASVGYNGTDGPIQGAPDRSTAQNKTAAPLPPAPVGIDSKASK